VVITLNNLCPPGSGSFGAAGAGCKKQITRAEFEKLVEAASPNLPLRNRRNLANLYVQLLILANQAEREGVEQDPQFQEMVQLVKMQLMARTLERKLQQQSAEITAAEVEQHYNNNAAVFQEITIRRIYIPRPAAQKTPGAEENKDQAKATAPEAKPEAEKKPVAADGADLQALAGKIRERAAAGEDPDKLEQEVFKTGGQGSPPPTTVMGARRRGSLPFNHEEQVFKLNAGEVSQPIADPSGFFIYKVEARRTLPLEQVESEIRRTLQTQKFQERMGQITKPVSAELNEAYFGPAPPPAPPAATRPTPPAAGGELERPSRPPRQGTPPTPPSNPPPPAPKPK